jgi:predicted transcriptional regulator
MPVKLSVNLPDETVELLKKLAEKRGTTMTQVLKEAVATENFLDNETRQGKKILIEEPDKTLHRLIFKSAS